jgi:transposase
MSKRRNFTREFKLKILDEIKNKSKAEVCREYEILPQVIDRWRREEESYGNNAFQGKGKIHKAEAKVAHYERLVGRLYAEIDLLKKTQDLLKEKEQERKRCSK